MPNETARVPIEMYVIASFSAIFGIIGNASIVLIVCRFPQLRKNCRYLQAALAAGDCVACLGQLLNNTMNMIITTSNLRLVRWKCLSLSIPAAAGLIYIMFTTVCISIDRCYAVIQPIKYWKLNKLKLCFWSVSLSLAISVSCIVATYLDVDLYDYPSGCIGAYSRSPSLNALVNYVNMAGGVLVVLIYPFTLIMMKIKARRLVSSITVTGNAHQSNYNDFLKKQMEASTSIMYVIAATTLLHILPSTTALVLDKFGIGPNYVKIARSFVTLSSTINASVNFLFYIWKEESMRSKFKRILSCTDNNAVLPIATVPKKNPGDDGGSNRRRVNRTNHK